MSTIKLKITGRKKVDFHNVKFHLKDHLHSLYRIERIDVNPNRYDVFYGETNVRASDSYYFEDVIVKAINDGVWKIVNND